MRVQFTIDETLGVKLQNEAHELGLSVSSYVRHIIKRNLENKKLNMVDRALLEDSELITFDEFKKQLSKE